MPNAAPGDGAPRDGTWRSERCRANRTAPHQLARLLARTVVKNGTCDLGERPLRDGRTRGRHWPLVVAGSERRQSRHRLASASIPTRAREAKPAIHDTPSRLKRPTVLMVWGVSGSGGSRNVGH